MNTFLSNNHKIGDFSSDSSRSYIVILDADKKIAAFGNEIAVFINDCTGIADPQSETPGIVIGVGGSGTKKKICKCMCRYLQMVRRKNRRE